MKMHFCIALLALASGSAAASADDSSVDFFKCPKTGKAVFVDLSRIKAAYVQRSVDIVQLSMAGKPDKLVHLVHPLATFQIERGDAISYFGSEGPSSAIKFFQSLKPVSFQAFRQFDGPIAGDPCDTIAVYLTLNTTNAGEAYNLKFTFEDAELASVSGNFGSLSNGQLTPQP